ncbi:cb8bafe8-6a00-4810-88c1-57d19072a576 [Sclerotinia trifoliorum]|uniref:Cb8bafe8-6a00-4810-88c1-57d19072a576 n=1 Tax=Sclerotinia trifoliorum TaxID=28548 RepID=A0A8H2VU18_9HELO|nr:cb8bafe8-6a00-4810-88c1-57d19072a576 [Sclerotinia trifoliorum]
MASSRVSVASDDDTTIKVAPKRERRGVDKLLGNIKLKKQPPKHNKPGNWREGSIIDVDEKKKGTDTPSTTISSPGPVVNMLDDSALETFATGRPLEDSPDLQVCKHCKKSVLKSATEKHVKACLNAKRLKLLKKKEAKEARDKVKKKLSSKGVDGDGDTKMGSDDDDDDDEKAPGGFKSSKKGAGKNNGDAKGKKRKADGEGEKGPKQKKKKEEPKPKAPKPKGPVDVERQCGVLKDGVPCARSLTCKSHSMGAKRAVPGRTLPYDMLLSQYQKKNQAKQQKAAIDANAPLEDEDLLNGPIDSDEELLAVQSGLANWNPQPLVPPLIQYPIQYRYRDERLWEQLHNATNGFTLNICKVKGLGAQKAGIENGENDGDEIMGGMGDGTNGNGSSEMGLGIVGPAVRRPSGFVLQGVPQRKQSMAGRA